MTSPTPNRFTAMLAHIPREPPRRAQELPGLMPLKSWGRLLLPLLPFVLFFGLFPLLIVTSDKEFKAQHTRMATVQGKVLEVRRTHPVPPQNMALTTIKYSFRVPQGTIYYGSTGLPENSAFAVLKPDSPLPVLYSPEDPSVNGIAGVLGKNAPPLFIFLFFPLFPLFFFAPILLIPTIPILRANKIFRRGKLTAGHIYFVTKNSRSSPFFYNVLPNAEVLFTFEDEKGQTIQGRQVCNNDWLLNKLDVGTEVTVVYMPKRPGQSIILEPFIA